MHMRNLLLAFALLGVAACKSGGNDGGSSGTPTSPTQNQAVTGPWTGTLSRPDGLPAITVRWEAAETSDGFAGPMTLTIGNSSIVVQGRGGTSGGGGGSYNLVLQLVANPGENTASPNCQVIGGTQGIGVPFQAPFKTIAVPSMSIAYTNCHGFINPPPQRTGVSETSQLNLTKP